MADYPEVDWNGPLVTAMVGIKVTIWEWEKDCKWLQVGMGRYMYNNDGTCVSGGGMRVFNPVDYLAMKHIEGRSLRSENSTSGFAGKMAACCTTDGPRR